MQVCAAVCAVALVANGVGIWMSETALWLPLLGAMTALIGLTTWATGPNRSDAACRTDKEDPS